MSIPCIRISIRTKADSLARARMQRFNDLIAGALPRNNTRSEEEEGKNIYIENYVIMRRDSAIIMWENELLFYICYHYLLHISISILIQRDDAIL